MHAPSLLLAGCALLVGVHAVPGRHDRAAAAQQPLHSLDAEAAARAEGSA